MKNLDLNKIKKKYDNEGFVVLKKFFKKKKIDLINIDLKT